MCCATLPLIVCCLAAPPLAVDDTYPLTPGGDTTVAPADGILMNDNVPCGTAVSIRVVTAPKHGTLTSPPARRGSFRKPARRGMEGGGFTYKPNDLANIVDDSYQYEIRCGDQVRADWACRAPQHADYFKHSRLHHVCGTVLRLSRLRARQLAIGATPFLVFTGVGWGWVGQPCSLMLQWSVFAPMPCINCARQLSDKIHSSPCVKHRDE